MVLPIKKRCFSVLLLLVLTSSLSASSLKALLEQYRQTSPTLKAQSARVQYFEEQAKGTTTFPAPEIGLEWGSRAVSPGMSNEMMYYQGFLIGQEFMFPGKRAAMQNAETERTHMAQADFRSAEKSGAFLLAQYYLEIHMIQERLIVVDSSLSLIHSILESAQRRYETGMGSMEDLFRIKAEIARLRSDSLSIVGDEKAMSLMLSASLGTTSPAAVPASIDFKDEAVNLPSLDSLQTLSLQRPEIESMVSEKRMASRESAVASLKKMPDVMLQGRYMNMMGPNEWSVMVGLKVPVAPWSSTEYRTAEQSSKFKEKEVEARVEAMKIMFQQEVKDSYTRYLTSQDKLKQVQKEQVTTAENALHSAQISFANGRSDLTMSLDALRMAVMAWETEIMSHMDALQAILKLERASGMYPGTWLQETTVTTDKHHD